MPINPDVFHAYDIRGRAPEEIDEEFAFRLGQAVVEECDAESVVVGRDMRVTSEALTRALMAGILSRGADVYDIGLCTTPLFYYAAADAKLPESDGLASCGVMVTASHNPSEYNGFKIVRSGAVPVGMGLGLEAIRDRVLQGRLPEESVGARHELPVLDAYVDFLNRAVPFGEIKPMTIVADAGNGMAGHALPALFHALPQLTVEPLYFDLDGRFPNHEPNPIKPETLAVLSQTVVAKGAALGVAYDGDADRIGFVDERGEYVSVDLVFALIARELVREEPGATVLHDVRTSRAFAEEVRAAGGTPVMHRVGHVYFKKSMRGADALFGAEYSGHCYWRSFFGVDCTDLALLYVLRILSREGRPFSEIIAPLRRYHHSGEINFTVKDKNRVLEELADVYGRLPDGRRSDIDGIRFDFPDWWFNVRTSNTEPLVRLNAEATTKEMMEKMRDRILGLIKNCV